VAVVLASHVVLLALAGEATERTDVGDKGTMRIELMGNLRASGICAAAIS
jgi:hypothetical protein